MDVKLFISAIIKFSLGAVMVAALLFLPAGTLRWFEGWLLMVVLFLPMFVAGIVMIVKSPDLLRKRLNAREEDGEQRSVIALAGLMFIAAFVVAGLGYRFDWISFPNWACYAGVFAFLGSYAIYAEVLRENAYLSRTIEVQDGQHVIDTGLYGIVRHPMYSATLLLFLSMPVILGSPYAFIIMLAYLPLIAKRLLNEERLLEKELPGYAEYMTCVKWRLIPRVW